VNPSREPGGDRSGGAGEPGDIDFVDFRVAMSRLAAGVSIVTALNA
jgi:hypothetical protein